MGRSVQGIPCAVDIYGMLPCTSPGASLDVPSVEFVHRERVDTRGPELADGEFEPHHMGRKISGPDSKL
jgi:hypothetical protein